jgi:predicted nucleic acid-binding protein
LINRRDALHEKALTVFARIAKDEQYTNEYVIVETLRVIERRINRNAARQAGADARNNLAVLWLTAREFDETYERFVTTDRLSFVDCSIITTMRALGIKHLVTFDKTFENIDGITLVN